jgi:mitochondrial chaperone BCS1
VYHLPYSPLRINTITLRYILLVEDVDAAFARGVSRDANSTVFLKHSPPNNNNKESTVGSTLSPGALLDSLNGFAAV